MEGRRLLESLLSARGDDCNRLIEVNQVGNENLTANKSRNSNIVTSNTNDNNTNNSRQRRRISRAQSVAKRLDEHRPPGTDKRDFGEVPLNDLDDICSRFIINTPERVRSNPIRLLFELELAHWYYLDFLSLKSSDNSIYPNLKFTEFTRQVLVRTGLLLEYIDKLDEVIGQWKEYKRGIPTAGAILLDKSLDHVVLVQGYYSHSWGFPKGKQNKAESEEDCAKREVREEVGYDIAEKISTNLFIEKLLGMTRARLYIITDVPVEYQFVPEARHEIKKIQWFRVSDLPLDRFNDTSCRASGLSYRNFYTVLPFVADLRRSIDRLRKERKYSSTSILPKKSKEYTMDTRPALTFKSGMHFIESLSSSKITVFDQSGCKNEKPPVLDKPVYVAPPMPMLCNTEDQSWSNSIPNRENEKTLNFTSSELNVDNINSYEAVFPSGNKCFMTKEPHENATVNLNRMNALTSCQESKNTECSANLRNTNADESKMQILSSDYNKFPLCEVWKNFKFQFRLTPFASY